MTQNPDQLPVGQTQSSKEAAGEVVSSDMSSWDELQIGFSGNPKTRMDERGRLKMPADFKAFIDRKYGKGYNTFYITSRDGESAEIFPLKEWLKVQSMILDMPQSSSARRKLLESDNLYGDRVDMDPQGRMQIPEELRTKADLAGDVKVYGEGHFLRVTSLKKLREKVDANRLTEQELDSLAGFGL
jgi:MraZ protein